MKVSSRVRFKVVRGVAAELSRSTLVKASSSRASLFFKMFEDYATSVRVQFQTQTWVEF